MNKRNLYTFLFLCAAMIAVIIFSGIKKIKASAGITEEEMTFEEIQSETMDIAVETEAIEIAEGNQLQKEAESEPKTESQPETETETKEEPKLKKEEEAKSLERTEGVSMENTLFIGDSRTVGLMEYAKIEGADFFCTVGMNVFEIYDENVSVPGVGRLKISELLENKKYDRIYIMLGINELGYPFDQIVRKYTELVNFVKEKQPEAIIFMQANLHVTKERSDRDKIFNNTNINKLNEIIKGFSDEDRIYYLDANEAFDDSNGALSADMSSDNAHLYARYYVTWGKWIEEQTFMLLQKGE